MTNAERQRKFQDAHPGYDRRRKARQRGASKRAVEAQRLMALLQAKTAAAAAAAAAAVSAAETVPAPVGVLRIPVPPMRLALPAPVELPVLPAINDLQALLTAARKVAA